MTQQADNKAQTAAAAMPVPGAKLDRFKLLLDYELEADVENWLAKRFLDLGVGAALIGRQIELVGNKRMDMLAVHKTGQVCIVELKRDESEREVFAQVLDYARLFSGFLEADLDAICRKLRGKTLADFFRQEFGCELPKKRPTTPKLVIVAQDFDEPHVHMAAFLKEHRFDLHLIRYTSEHVNGDRTFAFESVDISRKEFRMTGKMPDPVFVLRMTEQENQLWSDCKEQGHVSVSSGEAAMLREFLKASPVSLLVYLNNHGYVASGIIDSSAAEGHWPDDQGPVRLPIRWEVAVEFEQAVFRGKDDQPKAGEMIRLEPSDKDKWARLVGLLRFREAKTLKPFRPMKQPHLRRKRATA